MNGYEKRTQQFGEITLATASKPEEGKGYWMVGAIEKRKGLPFEPPFPTMPDHPYHVAYKEGYTHD